VVVGTENLNVGQHVVQFCGHDRELAGRVSEYLRGALGDGGVAIVIATPEHRSQFEARLGQAGADLAAARADGTYLTLDARETLREILDGATPDGASPAGAVLDRAAFDRVIGSVIRQAASSGRPVRAYGDLIALLWDDGLVNAAAQLETLWDELSRAQPFLLFRGYPPDWVPEALRIFAFSREAPATARHFAVAALREWGLADIADDAALVVTELAANAIVHAGSAFTVILSARGNVLRIAVRDGCPLPAEGQAALMPLPLHGLGAVDALAARWGVESLGKAGKTVWVDLRR
jgi:DcmR-like sensory protein